MTTRPGVRTEASLREFVRESNRIEGIVREPTDAEVSAHGEFLSLAAPDVTVASLCRFVSIVAQAPLRDREGMDVRVGDHIPERGGPGVRYELEGLLADIAHPYMASDRTPYEAHVEYETLHPFMDGNGRSGRVLWVWQMRQEGHDPFALPFLHCFYYQALSEARA